MPSFTRRTSIPVSTEDLFEWHSRPGALERLTPPWQVVEIGEHEGISEGAKAYLRIGKRFLTTRWEIEHREYEPGEAFTDVQIKGPFARWEHTHRMLPDDIDARLSILEDRVDYELPVSRMSQPLAGRHAERELVRMFGYRHRVIQEDLLRHQASGLSPLTIAVTGSTGLIGSVLVPFLTTAGHTVVRVVRSRNEQVALALSDQERTAFWDPANAYVEAGAFEGVDAVIHLAGESLFGKRWTRRQRARILDSRARGTRLLADTLAAMERPPGILLSASGSGYYGDRGHEVVTEGFPPGAGFLPDVCLAWERATSSAAAAGIRVCRLRFGPVLAPGHGLMALLLPVFRAGLGGTIGRGATWVSWVAIDDVLYALLHMIAREDIFGPFNVSAPHPCTQRKLADTLAHVLGRDAPVRIPASAVDVLVGRDARIAATASIRMMPERLSNSAFEFAYPHLTDALEHLLGRSLSEPVPSLV
jgi:uncharacterized protein